MKKSFALVAAIALIVLGLPALASAETFTYLCDPSTEPAPADWFGGPYTGQVRIIIDTTAKSVELRDKDNRVLGDFEPPARLSALNNYKLDLTVTQSTISWGVAEMWGFSGYIDRKSGRLDAIWINPRGYSPNTLNRQFHGTCKQRQY